MRITSTANPHVKSASKLRNPRQRTAQGRFAINGIREIGRALDGGLRLQEAFVCEGLCESVESQKLLERLRKSGATRFDVSESVYSVLAYGSRFDGVVAVAETPRQSLEDLHLPESPLVAVIEGVEKPGNVGGVLRSADGAGVSAVIVADGGSDLYNPNVIRSSMGTLFTLPVNSATSAASLDWLRKHGLAIYAARVDGTENYTACNFARPCALVLGSESQGLSNTWHGEGVTSVRLPMRGLADSLNISAAAAVLFYEALRQRT